MQIWWDHGYNDNGFKAPQNFLYLNYIKGKGFHLKAKINDFIVIGLKLRNCETSIKISKS